jgi:hypothetical protein
MMIDLSQAAVTALGTSVPIILFLLGNRERAKRDMEKRHEENQDLLREIASERKYIPPHGHLERSGPLSAENI